MRFIGDIEFVFVNSKASFFIREDLVSPGNDLIAEIIADREIAEHLEESMVTRRMADILDVVGAKGFLHVHDAAGWRHFAPVEILL